MSIMLSRPELALIAIHGPVEAPIDRSEFLLFYSFGITFTLNVGRLMNLDTRLGISG
jgi:hypothetical protein